MTASELHVLIQSVVVFTMFAAMFVCLHMYTAFTWGLVFTISMVYIVECGVGPVLYLSMNAGIRRHAWRMLTRCWRKKKLSSSLAKPAPTAITRVG